MGETTVLYPSLPNAQRIEYSKHYLKMILFAVETRPDGFDFNGIMAIVENWLMLGKNLRGELYPNGVQHMWIRQLEPRNVPHGRKRTQHLVDTLKRLNHFIHPGEQNLEGLYELFKECEQQVFDLVWDFRGRMVDMNHRDLGRYVDALSRVTARVKMRHL